MKRTRMRVPARIAWKRAWLRPAPISQMAERRWNPWVIRPTAAAPPRAKRPARARASSASTSVNPPRRGAIQYSLQARTFRAKNASWGSAVSGEFSGSPPAAARSSR
jgi:hypothetical protein